MQKKFLLCSIVLVGIALVGCETSTSSGGGGEIPQTDDGLPSNEIEKVKALPSFEGTFVSSESEAKTLASTSMAKIDGAISAALMYGRESASTLHSLSAVEPLSGISRSAYYDIGHYSYNGVSLDYSFTTSDNFPYYPCSITEIETLTINGTYGGYKIFGSCSLKIFTSLSSQYSVTTVCTYNESYAVSYNGVGMKVVITGSMNYALYTSSSSNMNYHYSVYDNSNILWYNYDYVYPNTVHQTLSGDWDYSGYDGKYVVTFNNGQGTFKELTSGIWLDAYNEGSIKVGDQCYRNLVESRNGVWTGEAGLYNAESPYETLGWISCKITLYGNGQAYVEPVSSEEYNLTPFILTKE